MEKAEESTVGKTFFDIVYEGVEKTIKTLKKPIVIRALKRKFQSALDSAAVKIDEAEANKQKAYENITEVDLNVLMKYCADVRAARNVIEDLKSEYKHLFEEALVVAD